mmetsp:Transcript_44199/g.127890  ORF Transcript_44199/g.127890 Transcript_44199/m.127890 type:complete len:221 (+) Transcript_44199:2380-3042(+)
MLHQSPVSPLPNRIVGICVLQICAMARADHVLSALYARADNSTELVPQDAELVEYWKDVIERAAPQEHDTRVERRKVLEQRGVEVALPVQCGHGDWNDVRHHFDQIQVLADIPLWHQEEDAPPGEAPRQGAERMEEDAGHGHDAGEVGEARSAGQRLSGCHGADHGHLGSHEDRRRALRGVVVRAADGGGDPGHVPRPGARAHEIVRHGDCVLQDGLTVV